MKKLELKHIAPYLPYGLKYQFLDHELENLTGLLVFRDELNVQGFSNNRHTNTLLSIIKPVLRPLTDMRLDIFSEQFFEDNSEMLGEEFTPLAQVNDFLSRKDKFDTCFPYGIWELFFRHHFDIFGLIDAGLAVDINTIK